MAGRRGPAKGALVLLVLGLLVVPSLGTYSASAAPHAPLPPGQSSRTPAPSVPVSAGYDLGQRSTPSCSAGPGSLAPATTSHHGHATAPPPATSPTLVSDLAAKARNPAPTSMPYGGSVVWDGSDGYLLLLDGHGDTWMFASGLWTNLTPAAPASPFPPSSGSLVYDASDGYVVFFGGVHHGYSLNETWSYHAGTWTNLSGGGPSPPVEPFAMTYDAGDHTVLYWGGNGSYPQPSGWSQGVSWTFHAGRWSQIIDLRGYPPLLDAPQSSSLALAYSTSANASYAYSTRDYSFSPFPNGAPNQTWSHSNGGWYNDTATSGLPPGAVVSPALLVDDPSDGYLFLPALSDLPVPVVAAACSGPSPSYAYPGFYGSSYALQGGSWREINRTLTPLGPEGYPLSDAYDPATGTVLADDSNGSLWSYHAGNWSLVERGTPYLAAVDARGSNGDAIWNLTQGETTTIWANATEGYPPYTYSYSGLPPGCMTQDLPVVTCAPNGVGRFWVNATVCDSTGRCTSSCPVGPMGTVPFFWDCSQANFYVYLPLTAQASVSPGSGVAPLGVSFQGGATGGNPYCNGFPLQPCAYRYAWDFGDGTVGQGASPTHVYNVPGLYVVSLVVHTSVNQTAYAGVSVLVTLPSHGAGLDTATVVVLGLAGEIAVVCVVWVLLYRRSFRRRPPVRRKGSAARSGGGGGPRSKSVAPPEALP